MKYVFQLEIEGEDFARCPDDTLAAVWLLQRGAVQAERPADREVMQARMRREIARRWLQTLELYSGALPDMVRLVLRLRPGLLPTTIGSMDRLRTTSDETLALFWMVADKQDDTEAATLDAILNEIADRWVSTLVLSPMETVPGRWSRPSITENTGAAT